jgi:hypothetical protein
LTSSNSFDTLVATIKEKTMKRLEYKGYTIEKSGFNFYVINPLGHRAFGEAPSSIKTAKKWIDLWILMKSLANKKHNLS